MKAKELKEDIYVKLVSLDYHRKVNFVDEEVTSSVDFKSFDVETRQAINKFYLHGFKPGIDLMGVELDGEQQFHILIIGDKYYLVDTQGYNYPRYIIELKNFEFEEDDLFEHMDGLIRIADEQIFNMVVRNLMYDLREENFEQEDIENFLQVLLVKAIQTTK
jgi:hypothetical protein